MLATVSARVPVEVRNQVHQKLKHKGSTPSQFINTVYASFLNDELSIHSKKKKKSAQLKKDEIVEIIRASTCNFDNPLPENFDFKAELERGRINDYEAIS